MARRYSRGASKDVERAMRKRKRRLSLITHKEESYTMSEGISEELSSALNALSASDRALVISRVVQGFEYDELAQIYGASAQALRKRYERAKKRLADELRRVNYG